MSLSQTQTTVLLVYLMSPHQFQQLAAFATIPLGQDTTATRQLQVFSRAGSFTRYLRGASPFVPLCPLVPPLVPRRPLVGRGSREYGVLPLAGGLQIPKTQHANAFQMLSLDALEPRYRDIDSNIEALIKGIRVFDIPYSDIEAIVPVGN